MNDHDTLTVEHRIKKGYPPDYLEYAKREAAQRAGYKLVEDLKEHKGLAVAYRLREEHVQEWDMMGLPKRVYLLQIERLAVTRQEYIRLPVTNFEPLAMLAGELKATKTKALLRELARRLKVWLDAQEPCSYTKPDSAYPAPETFLKWRD